MLADDPRCQNHTVFGELDEYISFYGHLATSVFSWVSEGTNALGNIDSYLYSSMEGTLISIRSVLRDGRINDAYSLLRKHHDSAIINIYSNLFLEAEYSVENHIVEQIDGWLKGKVQLPEYRVMSQYVRSSSKVNPITKLLDLDDRYKNIRIRCNDNMHFNFYKNILLNNSDIYLKDRIAAMDQFSADAKDLFVLHLAYLFCVNDNYMMSRDYIDALECSVEPEADSQYWVAPFVQAAFDNVLSIHRPDIVTAIKSGTNMQLL